MIASTNLFTDLPAHLPEELFTPLLEADRVRVERIVSHGHASPSGFWYDQARPEWVVLLAGAARLRFEDSEIELRPGDHVTIPAHARHRVEWTTPDEPTVWLALHYGD
jgi:cupin 2 domain-containing protein